MFRVLELVRAILNPSSMNITFLSDGVLVSTKVGVATYNYAFNLSVLNLIENNAKFVKRVCWMLSRGNFSPKDCPYPFYENPDSQKCVYDPRNMLDLLEEDNDVDLEELEEFAENINQCSGCPGYAERFVTHKKAANTVDGTIGESVHPGNIHVDYDELIRKVSKETAKAFREEIEEMLESSGRIGIASISDPDVINEIQEILERKQ